MKTELTAEILREMMSYDPSTGIFTRKIRTAQRHQVGDRADFPAHGHLRGYRQIGYKNEKVLAHRAAWLYVHGYWPTQSIDHINGNREDNRIENLRDVSQGTNIENLRRARVENASGLLGAHAHQGKWRSRIRVKGKTRYLGVFDTAEDAHEAYLKAKRQLHMGCTI
jgi:hypothetical protein